MDAEAIPEKSAQKIFRSADKIIRVGRLLCRHETGREGLQRLWASTNRDNPWCKLELSVFVLTSLHYRNTRTLALPISLDRSPPMKQLISLSPEISSGRDSGTQAKGKNGGEAPTRTHPADPPGQSYARE